ncbi:SDR family oxidoreductase [Methylomonas sp. EFPC3]|uniref:SDR family oxidoreductase n=1 Tax=Methylomonas sp. EFPC3 TaxID=3021710 RepID=UPI002417703E|nr:SDR family oxidoreductase [Methylomonas sp. EFPC3]WFP50287.1 SDR family oxidoreductase [Methylomonas sp. EFPC3]
MQTVLITGANRGLGLEFCRQYAAAGCEVIAACRRPEQAAQLRALAGQYSNIEISALDVADLAQIEALAASLAGRKIDVLINNAGVYGDQSGRGFGKLDYQTWASTLAINVMAPVKLAECFLPHLQRSEKPLIASLSSLMGSMADNTSGGSILYRSSKAGLNAAMKSLAIDLRSSGVGVLILHPGWVRTDMGGPNGLIDVEESVSGMRRLIAGFELADSGRFVKYDGSALPW